MWTNEVQNGNGNCECLHARFLRASRQPPTQSFLGIREEVKYDSPKTDCVRGYLRVGFKLFASYVRFNLACEAESHTQCPAKSYNRTCPIMSLGPVCGFKLT